MRRAARIASLLAAGALGACGSGSHPADVPGDAAADPGADAAIDPSPDGTGGCGFVPPVLPDDARLRVDPATGGLRDALDRDVVMRGINCGGRSKWAPFLPFPLDPEADLAAVRQAADAFFRRLVPWGLDTVRLPFSWEALEPARGQVDTRYLDRYEALVDAAWSPGLRVVVDFHQDLFSSPLCGDGFPPWTLPPASRGPPRHDCADWTVRYVTDERVGEAFDRFWADEDGIRTAFEAAWDRLAGRLGTHPGIAGFEILNEPGWGSAASIEAWKSGVLTPFHEGMAGRLQAAAPGVLVVYDNTGLDAVTGGTATYPRPAGEGLVFGPHYYDFGAFTGVGFSGEPPGPVIARMGAFQREQGAHVLLGEFGVPAEPDADALEWILGVMAAVDASRISTTLWEYSINEEPWNGEDLSVVDPEGEERGNLAPFVRPWLRAVAGTSPFFAWDPAADAARAEWTSDGGVTEIRVPAHRFPQGPSGLAVEGAGACHTWDAARGEIRVTAPSGTRVGVSFSSR